MWKKTLSMNILSKPNLASLQSTRNVNSGEIISRYQRGKAKVGWFRRKGSRLLYPTSNPNYMRRVGVDLNLQQRLDQMFAKEQEEQAARIDIGIPMTQGKKKSQKMVQWRKEQRSNKELAKAARNNTLEVNMADVKLEHENSGGLYAEIANAAELYGIYEDLFRGDYFSPILNLKISYDFDEELITPAYRGNVIKPHEAKVEPIVNFDSDPESLWTLVLTNPDGHFSEDNSEYVHWMVTNIPGNDFKAGNVVVPYLQPFPPFGSGFHRFVFVLFKQVQLILNHFCQLFHDFFDNF